MSGSIISDSAGQVPQRAIRYLDQLPYFVTYQSTAVIDFAGTTDKAYVAIGTTDAGQEIAYTPDIADGALTPITYRAGNNLNEGSVGNIIDAGDLVYCCGMDAEGTPTGQCFASVTFLYFE